MGTSTLGNVPALSRMAFIDGQDFFDTFEVTAPLPFGSIVSIEILNRDRTVVYGNWPLSLVANDYEIRIDADDHVGIIAGSWFRLWVTYPADGGRIAWLAGPVERNKR